MSAVRFPIAEGEVVRATEITHQAGYSHQTRIAVRYIVAYWPAGDDQVTVKMYGREQPHRLAMSAEQLDALIAAGVEEAVDADVLR